MSNRIFSVGMAVLISLSVFSQVPDESLYERFHHFFNKEVRHQGVKGDWHFGLKEITGTHRFDVNEDGVQEVLMLYTAESLDGAGALLYGAVLFVSGKGKYHYADILNSEAFIFEDYTEGVFLFRPVEGNGKRMRYELHNGEFVAN